MTVQVEPTSILKTMVLLLPMTPVRESVTVMEVTAAAREDVERKSSASVLGDLDGSRAVGDTDAISSSQSGSIKGSTSRVSNQYLSICWRSVVVICQLPDHPHVLVGLKDHGRLRVIDLKEDLSTGRGGLQNQVVVLTTDDGRTSGSVVLELDEGVTGVEVAELADEPRELAACASKTRPARVPTSFRLSDAHRFRPTHGIGTNVEGVVTTATGGSKEIAATRDGIGATPKAIWLVEMLPPIPLPPPPETVVKLRLPDPSVVRTCPSVPSEVAQV